MSERHLVIVSSKDDCLKLKRLRFGENAEVLVACCVAGVSADPDCLAPIAKTPNVVVSATDIREIEDVVTKFDITSLETALVEGIWGAVSRSSPIMVQREVGSWFCGLTINRADLADIAEKLWCNMRPDGRGARRPWERQG